MVSASKGYFTSKSKLAYGNAISTAEPLSIVSAIVKVKVRFLDNRLWWRASFTQYISAELSHASPSFFSNS